MQSERICTTDGTSVRIDQSALSLSEEPWSYAEDHRDGIAAVIHSRLFCECRDRWQRWAH